MNKIPQNYKQPSTTSKAKLKQKLRTAMGKIQQSDQHKPKKFVSVKELHLCSDGIYSDGRKPYAYSGVRREGSVSVMRNRGGDGRKELVKKLDGERKDGGDEIEDIEWWHSKGYCLVNQDKGKQSNRIKQFMRYLMYKDQDTGKNQIFATIQNRTIYSQFKQLRLYCIDRANFVKEIPTMKPVKIDEQYTKILILRIKIQKVSQKQKKALLTKDINDKILQLLQIQMGEKNPNVFNRLIGHFNQNHPPNIQYCCYLHLSNKIPQSKPELTNQFHQPITKKYGNSSEVKNGNHQHNLLSIVEQHLNEKIWLSKQAFLRLRK